MADIALILSADKYAIPDAQGVVQNLHQVWMSNEYRVSSDTEKGCKPMKVMVEAEVFNNIMKHDLPGLFDVDVKMRPGKGNALAATVVGFKFIGVPKIFPNAAAIAAAAARSVPAA
jgi:hypothetical protein